MSIGKEDEIVIGMNVDAIVSGAARGELALDSFVNKVVAVDQAFKTSTTNVDKRAGTIAGALEKHSKASGSVAAAFETANKTLAQHAARPAETLNLRLLKDLKKAYSDNYESRLAVHDHFTIEDLKLFAKEKVGLISAHKDQLNAAVATERLNKRKQAERLKDLTLNTKYATDMNTARLQIEEKGTSALMASLTKRAENIRRLLESGNKDAIEIAKKQYGSDFVATMQQGLKGGTQVLAKEGETRLALIDAMAKKEKERLKARNIGTTGDKLGKAEVVGDYEPYSARRARSAYIKAQAATELAIQQGLQADLLRDAERSGKERAAAEAKMAAEGQKISEKAAQSLAQRSLKLQQGLQADLLRDAERSGKERAAAEAKMAAEGQKISEKAAQSLAQRSLKLQQGLQADRLRDMERAAKERIATEARMAAEEVQARSITLSRQARAQINSAMQDAGTYQRFSPSTGVAGRIVNQVAEVIPPKAKADLEDMSKGFKKLAIDGNDAHSAMRGLASGFDKLSINGNNLHSVVRGLASGFGALWLTWGATVPLLSGAAISFSLAKAVSLGSEFESVMFSIGEVAGTSAEGVSKLRSTVLDLGTKGMYGPLELAKGLEVLSLAGLNATEALSALGPTLRFAAAGGIDMAKAAEVTVAVGQAYAFTAAQYETVQDIITKTSTDTMASVSDMSEAFKTASVVAQQFNLSLTDTAEGLGTLAQIGIKGTAAGTSYRNFYTEITKQSGKVAEALQSLKVNIRQVGGAADGELKPTIEIFRELSLAMVNKTKASQDSYFAALSNERGGKEFAAQQAKALETAKAMTPELIKEAAALDDMGKKSEAAAVRIKAINIAFDEMSRKSREATANAAGQNFLINAEKQLTPEGQIKSLKAAMETGLIKAFEGASDSLMVLGNALHTTLASPEFQSALASLVKGTVDLITAVVGLTKTLWDHKEVVASLAAAYILLGETVALTLVGAFGAAKVASVAFFAEIGGGAAVMAAMRSNVIGIAMAAELAIPSILAMGSALAAGAALAAVAAVTVAVIAATAAVGALAVKWLFMGESAEEASRKALDAEIVSRKEASEALRAKMDMFNTSVSNELKASEDTLKARQAGLTKDQAADKVYAETAIRRVEEYYSQLAALERLAAKKEQLYYLDQQMYDPVMAASVAQAGLEVKLAELEQEKLKAVSKTRAETSRLLEIKKLIAAYDLKASVEARKALKGKDNDIFGGDGSKAKTKVSVSPLTFGKDNTLAELEKRHATELGLFDKLEADKRSRLDARRDSEIISEGQFFGEMLNLTSEYSRKRIGVLDTNLAQYEKDLQSRRDKIMGALYDWSKANPKASAADVTAKVDQTADAMHNLSNTANSFYERLAAEKEKAGSSVFTLLQAEANKTIKQVNDLKKSTKEFWESEERSRAKSVAAQNLAESLRYADPEYAAGVLAAAEAQNRLNDEYERLTPELRKAEKALQDLIVTQLAGEDPLGGFFDSDAIAAYTAKVTLLREQMEKLKNNTSVAGAASAQAKDLFNNTERARLSESLADAVILGMTEGGDEAAKSIRKLLEDELIRKPFKIMLSGVINSVLGGAGSSLASNALGQAGSGMLSNLLPTAGLATYAKMFGGALADGWGAAMAGNATGAISGGLSTAAGASGAAGASVGIGQAIGAAAPYVLAAMAVAEVASGLNGGREYTTGTGLSGNFSGDSFSGRNYQRWKNDGDKIFGISVGHSSSGTNYSDMSADTMKRWSTAFVSVKTAVAGSATALGLSTDLINSYTKSIDLAAGSTTETVTAIFTGMADELASRLVPNIAGFAKEGESASTTLNRLAVSLASVNASLAQTGQKTFAVSVAGAEAATALADLHGGLETLQSRTASYYANYFTDEERAAKSMESMRKALATVNKTLPESKTALREMVEGLNLKSEADRAAHVVLMAMQEEFSTAMDVRAKDAAKAAEEAAAAADKIKETWRSIGDSLLTEADRIRGVVAQESGYSLSYLQSKFAMLTAATRAGDQTAGGELAGVASALNDAAAAQASSALELAILRSSVANSLVRTDQIVTGGRVSVNAPILTSNTAEDTKAMRAQIEALNARINELLTNTKAENQAQFSALNRLVSILDSTTQGGTSLSVTTRNGETVKTS